MSNQFVEVNILFDEIPTDFDLQDEITGEVLVKVHKKVSFDYLRINLFFELRGKASPVSIPGKEITLVNNGTWNVGETYRYSFRFFGGLVPTYRGYNLQTLWYLNATYLLTENSQKDTGTYKFYKKIFSSRMVESQKETLIIKNKTKTLQVENNSVDVPDGNYYWIISFIVLFFCYLAFQSGKMSGGGYVIPAIAAVISFVTFGLYLRDYYYFSDMKIRFLKEKPEYIQAEILLNRKKNSLDNVHIGYKIVEKVLDDRGTSTVTLTNDNYKYLHQEPLKGRHGVISVDLPLPESTRFPASFSYGKHEINWVVFLQTPGIFSRFLKEIPIRVIYK
jgi:hypothetical protein